MAELELSKYVRSEAIEIKRSEIFFADYNPRVIDDEEKKTLKRGIKKYGLAGGIVVNRRTGNTLVSGHQRLTVIDELQKYNHQTHENDYMIRVDLIDCDEKEEKELNILMNNPNAQGRWDYDALARIVPDIDYKDAGLTDADLNMIGVDFLLQTEEENNIADELDELMSPVRDIHEAEMQQRKLDREAQREIEREEKKQHMKDVKQQVKEAAIAKAEEMDAYVMLSFSTWNAKADFCERFGYPAEMKIIKGEIFADQVERID